MTEYLARNKITGQYSDCDYANVKFPADISYGSVTILREEVEGDEINNPRGYNITPGVKTQAQLAALIAFFRARKGRKECFWLKDWVSGEMVLVRFSTDRISATLDNYGAHSHHAIMLHEVELFKRERLEMPYA